jgi:hypothetical protein
MEEYKYDISGTVQSNYKPVWSGKFEGLNLGIDRPLHTDLTIRLCNTIQARKGGIWLTEGNRTTVRGVVVVNGERWNYEYTNYGTTLELNGRTLKGGYFDLLLKEITDKPLDAKFENLEASTYLRRWGSAAQAAPQKTNNGGGGGHVEPEPEPEPSSDGEDDGEIFDLFG